MNQVDKLIVADVGVHVIVLVVAELFVVVGDEHAHQEIKTIGMWHPRRIICRYFREINLFPRVTPHVELAGVFVDTIDTRNMVKKTFFFQSFDDIVFALHVRHNNDNTRLERC